MEPVRLVIWDLDETFWNGTLSEGGIHPVEKHITLIKALSERGIVNSICSKNNFGDAEAELKKIGAWEYFIFPQIAFAPKGPMIKAIVEATNLRPETMMFIDDNPMNLNEALFFYPGMQVADPGIIGNMLEDDRFQGKPDVGMDRLARYKVLEEKHKDRQDIQGDNISFLKQSGIRVSFHYDIEKEFDRIHELVNRTNQLNFTKNRWPEDRGAAWNMFQNEFSERFPAISGYVKVSDKYGNYGICGFFLIGEGRATHFLFSCRIMSMGVEQFCWNHLMRPHVHVVGDVISSLDGHVDWIEIVDDVDDVSNNFISEYAKNLKVCLRGACDFTSMEHYFRARYNVIGEFPLAYKSWAFSPWVRTVAVTEALQTPEGRKLLQATSMFPENYLESAVISGEADIYVLSFSVEYAAHLYRSRSTGVTLSLCNDFLAGRDFSETSYETLVQKFGRDPGFSESEWEFMQNEFEFFAHHDIGMFMADVCKLFEKLKGKKVIVLVLNERIGTDNWIRSVYGNINRIVVPLSKIYGFDLVDYGKYVRSTDDLAAPDDHGVHFSREVYLKMATEIMDICDKYALEVEKTD